MAAGSGEDRTPILSVIVCACRHPAAIRQTLGSLEGQRRIAEIEVIVADGTRDGALDPIRAAFPWTRHVAVPGGNMPTLKGAAICAARSGSVAILDPTDAAAPDWVDAILAALERGDAEAVGGTVLLDGSTSAANQAAYLFEYGAFNPPYEAGVTSGDLPGNSVAYRRAFLQRECADILRQEGFNKPFCHQRIRARGGRLVLDPAIRVHHLTRYRFLPFSLRRFHYGRCFGAKRWQFASPRERLMYAVFGPTVPALLAVRHTRRALAHPVNRRMLGRAWPALIGICIFWGVGEWLGYWFGPGRSCEEFH